MRRIEIASLFAAIACSGILPTACLVDEDKLCGDSFVQVDDHHCVCPEGSIVVDGECERCGRHEEVRGNTCVCEQGYARDGDGACQPADEDATDDDGCDADECESATDAPGTTDAPDAADDETERECSASSDCAADELCDIHSTHACIPWPEGLGDDCSSDEDCAGTEAEFCEVFSSRTCQIDGCRELAGICPGDMACCDFAVLSRSLCIPADRLEDGACPAPGELVERGESQ